MSARPSTGGGGAGGGDGVEGIPARWVRLITGVVAPTTALTALLFYFGFVWTDSFYEYFGVDAATLGFSTQDYLLRSVGALYVPAGAVGVVALLVIWTHAVLTRWMRGSRRARARIGRAGLGVAIAGAVTFLVGIVGVLHPFGLEIGQLATPVCLGLGTLAVGYGRFLFLRSRRRRRTRETDLAERAGLAAVVALATLAVFWSANTYAEEYGRGEARNLAAHLTLRPEVTLDTKERIFFPGAQETALMVNGPGQQFKYRYRGLRLLAQSGTRMFLIPASMTSRYEVLMLDYGPDFRVWFRPS